MTTLAQRLAALSPRQREVLERRLEAAGTPIEEIPILPRADRTKDAPLSFSQERLWFLDQLEPGNPAYHVKHTQLLEGRLDVAALFRSLGHVVERHEALRTSFTAENGEPRQRFGLDRPVVPISVDLSRPELPSRHEAARRLAGELIGRSFCLEQGPLFRVGLFRLTPAEHVLVVVLHHIVADGASMELLLSEVLSCYAAFSAGREPELPPLPVRYSDFAVWQRRWIAGKVLEKELLYWRRQLRGAPPLLTLPTDRPRPPVQTYKGALYSFQVSRGRASALAAFAREARATLFMTLAAGLQAVLMRYSGQRDLCVGMAILGRHRAEIERLVGFFANTLVLRTDLRGVRPSFRELVERIRQGVLEAEAHQNVPFEKLVEDLKPERNLAHSPIFQVMFAMQAGKAGDGEGVPGLVVRPFGGRQETTTFDLNLEMTETAGGRVAGSLFYSTDLFDPTTLQRFAGDFLLLLGALAAQPDVRFDDVVLCSASGRHQVLAEWNDTAVRPRFPGPVHEVFSERAAATPENVAVGCGGHELRYRELDELSDRLAGELARRGVTSGALVGVALTRSPEMLVALLGVLKAGAAYVPLDPSYPRERLAFMLEDSGASVVVSESPLAEALPAGEAEVLLIDQLGQGSAGVPRREVRPEELAYVIYTSGSTGRPKGVEIPHRALVNFLGSMSRRPGLGPRDVLVAVTSLSFDIAALELFLPLLVGGRLEIATAETAADGAALLDLLESSGTSVAPEARSTIVMQATPATWRLLLAAGWDAGRAMRVLCGGEALQAELAEALAARSDSVWNLYGPTETTVWSSVWRVGEGPVSIGRPIANTELHVLDSGLAPVPIGAVGDLYIGGDGLARGYHHRPALTAVSFVPAAAGRRLYRTGDLARRRADGRLECLGRSDHQVKVRGFRIELGEIETRLARAPGVAEAVALAVDSERLVAWVVAVGEPGPTAEGLRSFLLEHLPAYMVPGRFVFLDEMPLTPNGKVDRKALLLPEGDRPDLESAYVAPRTPVEETLAAIWGELLGVDSVGVHDNFFTLGGHSLLGTRLVSRVEQAFEVSVPLRGLFEGPTVAEMARAVARRQESGDAAQIAVLPTVEPDPENRYLPFPLTDVQQAYWIGRSSSLELGSVATHVYFDVDAGPLDLGRLESALARLIERHDMLRAVVRPDGKQQVLPEVAPYEIEVLELAGPLGGRGGKHSLDAEAAQARLAEVRAEMSHQVLPSDEWPLFEIRASRLAEDRVRLHVSVDLLIGDAWSFQVLGWELAALYADPPASGRSPSGGTDLPPLELTFRDYVLAYEALRETPLYERARRYWQDRLPTLPPAPELPLAKAPGAIERPRFVRRHATLSAERWRDLQGRATRAGLTPSGVLLAAFAEVLACWSRNRRFTINLTLFNRWPLHPEVDRIVGDFTSLTLLEVDPAAGDSFEARARRLQRQLWEDLDHRLVSGVEVLRDLARARGGDGTAQMPVVFTSTLNMGREEEPAAEQPEDGDAGREESFGITQTPQVWLDHQVTEHRGRLVFNWDVVEELFPDGLIDAMFGAYRDLLERLAGDEETWRSERLGLVPASQLEARAASRLSSLTEAPVPARLLHEPFLEQARRDPDRPAVLASDRTVSYGELLTASYRLGSRLRNEGALPGQLVAVVLEKGWEQVAAVLGVLRSGAAYLPVDPSLPEKRRAFLLEHGRVELVVTRPELDERLEWPENVRTITLDPSVLEGEPEGELEPVGQADDLAYVIFTSGSTGRPKGVMIDHRGALNTCLDVNRRFGVGPHDRVLALSALSFDLSVYDVFGVLAAGGALVMPQPRPAPDPRHWAELVSRHRVTVWNTVPALMEILADDVLGRGGDDLCSLRLVLLSGDWIPVSLPERLRAAADPVEVVSLGGATEASIWSILYPIGTVPAEWTSIPYGRPMANQTLEVLDAHLEPRPVWTPGELYIGGAGLARGYWRDEEKTAASFLTHPRTGERLYRTGDLGRWLPSGDVEFLGREDFQVKVGGHRIELGEIEAALAQADEVRQAAVAALGEDRSQKRLVGYVVLEEGVRTDDDGIESSASARMNPLEELEIKLKLPGVRKDLGDRSAVRLGRPAGESFRAPYLHRRSYREFLPEPLPAAAVHEWLDAWSRTASPGAVEVLVSVRPGRVTGTEPGIYRYPSAPSGGIGGEKAAERCLERLAEPVEIGPGDLAPFNLPILEQSAIVIFLVTRGATVKQVYGDGGRELAMVEAGAVSQSLMELAPEWGVGLCPIGFVLFEAVRTACGLDRDTVLIHSLLGGAVRPDRLEAASDPAETEEPLSAQRLGRFLACLLPIDHPDFPLPKYRYASAGNLYPVQTYVEVCSERIADLLPGLYYHHPGNHELIRLADRQVGQVRSGGEEADFSLVFVAQTKAIVPFYGPLAEPFCWIEAGYVLRLLEDEAPLHGLGLDASGSFATEGVRELFSLDEGHLVLGAVRGFARPRAKGGLLELAVGAEASPVVAEGPRQRLVRHLQSVLPAYMVPSTFVFLDALPLSANGKVDRSALPAPEEEARRPSAAYKAPRGETERKVAAIFQEILKVEKIGVEENFFEIGGNSVHLVQVSQRLRTAFQKEVPLVDLFARPTISKLAAHLGRIPAREPPAEPDDWDEKLKVGRHRLRRRHQQTRSVEG